MGYPVWGFRIEKKSPDFRSPEVGISGTGTSLQMRLMWGVFSNANDKSSLFTDIPPHGTSHHIKLVSVQYQDY